MRNIAIIRGAARAAFLLLSLSACAGNHPPAAPAAVTDRDVLTQAQMTKAGYVIVSDAVSALRPGWLTVRGRDTLGDQGDLVVIRDGMQIGGRNALLEIAVANVSSLRYHDPLAASARWGLCCSHGVIYVTTLGADTRR